MSQSKKPIDFSDMSYRDVVAMLMNTAVIAKDSGHRVSVRNATVAGEAAIVIVAPGYKFVDGTLRAVAETVAAAETVAKEEQP